MNLQLSNECEVWLVESISPQLPNYNLDTFCPSDVLFGKQIVKLFEGVFEAAGGGHTGQLIWKVIKTFPLMPVSSARSISRY
jgi:hypothetical protein